MSTPETPLVTAGAPDPVRTQTGTTTVAAEEDKNKNKEKGKDEKKKKTKKPARRYFRPAAPLDHAARVYSGLAMSLVFPVTITMAIIVWSVQTLGPVDNRNPVGTSTAVAPVSNVNPAFVVVKESPDKSTGENIGGALVNMLIVVAAITVITFIMVILYKYGYAKILYVWLGLSAAMVFFFLSGLFLDLIATRYQIPYDYVMFAIMVWNFGVVGLLSVFYLGHPLVTQFYLVVVSVIVAWGLTQTPEWTTWAILVGVAVYDIVAVLCPKGPLNLLVRAAQERQEPIPGFVYDSDGGPALEMRGAAKPAHPPDPPATATTNKPKGDTAAAATTTTTPTTTTLVVPDNTKNSNNGNNDDDDDFLPAVRPENPMDALEQRHSAQEKHRRQQQQQKDEENKPITESDVDGNATDIDALLGGTAPVPGHKHHHHHHHQAPANATTSTTYGAIGETASNSNHETWSATRQSPREGDVAFQRRKNDAAQQEKSDSEKQKAEESSKKQQNDSGDKDKKKKAESSDEEEEDPFEAAHYATPFKLGLGDFIFYSLLVGRAALSMPTTQTPWIVCYICIIAGMGATLASLLFLRGKVPALPALPFSIFAATIAFFVTRYVTLPYWDWLSLNAFIAA